MTAIRDQITELDDDAQHHVLLTPYGGLIEVDAWYSTDFREALNRVSHLETSSLDKQVILFDARSTVVSCRKPEEKEGLVPVGDTSIAIGVFEDVLSKDGPQVRLESGEYFVVWPGDEPRVVLFGADPGTAGGAETS